MSAIREPVDVLVALNQETIDLHRRELAPGGVVLYDSERTKQTGWGSEFFGLPMEKLAVDNGGDRIMSNTVALGAALAMVGYDPALLNEVLRRHFGSGQTADANIAAAKAGYDLRAGTVPWPRSTAQAAGPAGQHVPHRKRRHVAGSGGRRLPVHGRLPDDADHLDNGVHGRQVGGPAASSWSTPRTR